VKYYGSPHPVADAPKAENVFKCQLKALDFSSPDYARISFTSDQKARLAAADYLVKYEAKYGKDSRPTFGGHAWDSCRLLARAIREALKKANPGTKEFRIALRDALENTKELVATHVSSRWRPTSTTASTTARGR